MAHMKRRPVNKRRSARKFQNSSKRVKVANIVQPMRGGIRM